MAIHEIIVPLNKRDISKFRDSVKKTIGTKVGPEISKVIRNIFFFRNMETGDQNDWATFRNFHAGIFPGAILDNINKKDIKLSKSNVRIEYDPDKKRHEIIIKGDIKTPSDEVSIDAEAVIKAASNLSPGKVKTIFESSMRKAGYN